MVESLDISSGHYMDKIEQNHVDAAQKRLGALRANKQDRIDAAMQLLGITQAQYIAIIHRWDDSEMMDVPAPFVYGASDACFRAWTTSCLTDERGIKELEKIIGPGILPDFSAYTPSSPPLYRPHLPQIRLWDTIKRIFS